MRHKIVEAIIENGKLKHVDKKLPDGRIMVHIIYNAEYESLSEAEASKIVKETSGIYKDINIELESNKLRDNWERNVYR